MVLRTATSSCMEKVAVLKPMGPKEACSRWQVVESENRFWLRGVLGVQYDVGLVEPVSSKFLVERTLRMPLLQLFIDDES